MVNNQKGLFRQEQLRLKMQGSKKVEVAMFDI
jgi:hypothetical protein